MENYKYTDYYYIDEFKGPILATINYDTIKKQEVPKFKIGDIVKYKIYNTFNVGKITFIRHMNDYYYDIILVDESTQIIHEDQIQLLNQNEHNSKFQIGDLVLITNNGDWNGKICTICNVINGYVSNSYVIEDYDKNKMEIGEHLLSEA